MLAKLLRPILFKTFLKSIIKEATKSTKNKLDDKGAKVVFKLIDGKHNEAVDILVDSAPEAAEMLYKKLKAQFER